MQNNTLSDHGPQNSQASSRIFLNIFTISFVYILFIAGPLQYYGNIQAAYWLNYIFPIVLLLSSVAFCHPVKFYLHTFVMLFFIFYGMIIISCMIFSRSLNEVIMGIRIYFPTLLTFLAISAVQRKSDIWNILERILIFFPFIQLPFVLHQHFFIAQARTIGWDAVVGTFPGSAVSGGDSPGLALLCCYSLLTAYYLMKSRNISFIFGMSIIATNLAIIALGEVKSIIALLPIMAIVQRGRALYSRPIGTLAIVAAASIMSLAFVKVYADLYWSQQSQDVSETLADVENYFFSEDFVRTETGEISRGASISFWVKDGELLSFDHLFGYGPGSTRGPVGDEAITASGGGPVGRAAAKFPGLNVGATSLAQLLWDLGLVGTTLFLLSLISAIFRALTISNFTSGIRYRYRYRTVASLLVAVITFSFYNSSFVNLAAEQFFLAVILALLVGRVQDFANGENISV